MRRDSEVLVYDPLTGTFALNVYWDQLVSKIIRISNMCNWRVITHNNNRYTRLWVLNTDGRKVAYIHCYSSCYHLPRLHIQRTSDSYTLMAMLFSAEVVDPYFTPYSIIIK